MDVKEEKHLWMDTDNINIQICIKCGMEQSLLRGKGKGIISNVCSNSRYADIHPQILKLDC